MLIAIDLQNDYFHPDGEYYFPGSEDIVQGIRDRLLLARMNHEVILATRNVYDDQADPRLSAKQLRWLESFHASFSELLESAYVIEKTYHGIPPEAGADIRRRFEDRAAAEPIEFLGVETNVCVLANLNIIQNIFPRSDFRVNPSLVASSDAELHFKTLDIFKGLKIELINHPDKTFREEGDLL